MVRLAGAARLGEVQVDSVICMTGGDELGCRILFMHDEGAELEYFYSRSMELEQIFVEQIFADGYAKLFSGHSESAPVHISAASARRRCPTLAIKLSRCCEMGSSFQSHWRRRDRVRASPRQLCQLRWRSARAGGFLWSSGFNVDPACRGSFEVTFEDIFC